MERKNLTLFEGLFAVVVMSIMGIATTFYAVPLHGLDTNGSTFFIFLLELSSFLLFYIWYYSINSIDEINNIKGLQSIQEVYEYTNINWLCTCLSFILDYKIYNFLDVIHRYDLLFWFYMIGLLFANLIVFILVLNLEINSPQKLILNHFTNFSSWIWLFIYGVVGLLFILIGLAFVYFDFPTVGFFWVLNCFILLNLLSCRMQNF